MRNSALLVFANKQDLPGALSTVQLCAAFGLSDLRGRAWHVQGAVATRGEGLYEGLDWRVQAGWGVGGLGARMGGRARPCPPAVHPPPARPAQLPPTEHFYL